MSLRTIFPKLALSLAISGCGNYADQSHIENKLQTAPIEIIHHPRLYQPISKLSIDPEKTFSAASKDRLKLQPYQYLLQDPRIQNAINLNPLIENEDYVDLLEQKILEIEKQETQNWDDYRLQTTFSLETQRELYLRKVAMSMFTDVHDLVDWKILDYPDQYLNLLISDGYTPENDYLGRLHAVFNGNPLQAFNYVQEIGNSNPQIFHDPDELLKQLVIRMREDGWLHFLSADNLDCDLKYPDGSNFWDF